MFKPTNCKTLYIELMLLSDFTNVTLVSNEAKFHCFRIKRAVVASMRKTLPTSLVKLSAYMSQLQKETIGVKSSIKDLRRHIREMEELVKLRQEKVDSMGEVLRVSHNLITMSRQDMTSREGDISSCLERFQY